MEYIEGGGDLVQTRMDRMEMERICRMNTYIIRMDWIDQMAWMIRIDWMAQMDRKD